MITPGLSQLDTQYDAPAIPVGSRWFGSWRLSVERRALSAQEITHRYNDQAKSWQQKLGRFGIPKSYDRIAKLIVNRLRDSGNSTAPLRTLDCGVGTAELPLALYRHLPDMQLQAVDLSPLMLIEAKNAFASAGVNAELKLSDVRQLPFAKHSFDLVIAAHVLEHLPRPTDALSEIARVLKPGGTIVCCCTRRSLAGALIQMKWHTHAVTHQQLKHWLQTEKFDQTEFVKTDQSVLDKMSLICFAESARTRLGAT